MKKVILLLIVILITASCGAILNKKVNPYYFGMKIYDSNKLKKVKDVKVYKYNEDNLNYFFSKGYKIKAKSAFTETYVHLDWAKLASKQLGTPIMLLREEYAGSRTGRRVLSFRIPGEQYVVTSKTKSNLDYNSNTNAFVTGSDGYATGSSSTYGNAEYNSTTRTVIQAPDKYGYKSVRYENHYYDYYAVFLVKEYREGDKKAPKKYIRKSKLKYNTDTFLKKKPDYDSESIKKVNDSNIIYVIKENASNSFYDKVYVNGHYGYIIGKLIE